MEFKDEEVSKPSRENGRSGLYFMLKCFADVSLLLTIISILFAFYYYEIFITVSAFSLTVTVVLYFFAFNANVSYDYSVNNGIITIYRIAANKFRKKKCFFDLRSDVSAVGIVDSASYNIAIKDKKLLFYSANKSAAQGKKLLYFTVEKNNCVIAMECGVKFYNSVSRFFAPSVLSENITFDQ